MEHVLSHAALMEHILSLVDDPDSRMRELGAILEWDPSLSTSVTRKAALSYGLPLPSCSLSLALALLGSRVVKETLRGAITTRATRDLVIGVFDMEGIWQEKESLPSHENGPLPEFHCSVLEAQLGNDLTLLPADMRVILALRYYEGLSAEAIADITGRTPEEVCALQEEALERLREALGRPHVDQSEEPPP